MELEVGLEEIIFISMFKAALFTIATGQKQHKCPLTDEWTKKARAAYDGMLFRFTMEGNSNVCSQCMTGLCEVT